MATKFSFLGNTDAKARLSEILGNFELPRFRKAIFETLRRLRDPDSSNNQIGQVMSTDADLVSRVMRTVNSTAYAPRCPITSLDHAIAMMGNSALERIVMVIGARAAMPSKVPQYMVLKEFWKTAGKRAVLAKEIADATMPAKANLSFSAGFLQDISVPLIAASKGDVYSAVYTAGAKGEGELHTLEREAFGWDHAELGTMVCSEWDMPEDLAGAIMHQNVPGHALCPPAVGYVASLCDAHPESWNEEFAKIVKDKHPDLSEERIKEIIAQCGPKADELAKMLG